MGKCIVMSPEDNVATVLQKTAPGEMLEIYDPDKKTAGQIAASEPIPFGHKISLGNINKNGNIIKYGEIIGKASADIIQGGYVHIHNVISIMVAEKKKQERI